MKLMSYMLDGQPHFGIAKGDGVIDLTRRLAGQGIATLRDLLAMPDGLAQARAASGDTPDHAFADIAFAPVIPNPDKIICVGLNYRDHVAETGRTETVHPTLFARFAGSQVGHAQPMVKPRVSDDFDYEGEIAVIIGRPGRHIPAGEALGHIAGYACYNEGSVRDWQRHTSQFLAGKSFAGTGAFGPWMVTTDDIPDPSKLTLETRLNGAVMQHTTTDLMITDVPSIIAYCSTVLPLLPGDVIVSGTPGGVGSRRTPPVWLKPGDTVEVEVSGIGILRNPVVAEAG